MTCIIFVIVIFYILLLIKVYVHQDSKIFNPQKAPKKIYLDIVNLEKIFFKTSDNTVLEGAFVKNSENNPLLIYFGGNSNNALAFLNLVKDLKDFNFLVFNYRGYANSKGKPSQDKIFSDATQIYDNFAKGKDVYLVGRSLGSSVASYLASKRDIKGLVLITPFDSILNLAKDKYPYLPMKLILKHPFETYKYIKTVKAPVALIEVENDEVIPKKHSLNLKKHIKNLVFKKILTDTTHMAVFTHPDFLTTFKKTLDILRKQK